MYRKEYPVISKNMVRQRLISSHSHLAGKLGAGVLTGHPQVLSSYQYETGVPLSNSDAQDPISNHFPQSREPSLLYHCFKHRGMFLATVLLAIVQNQMCSLSTIWFKKENAVNYITLQIMRDTWSLDVSGHIWRHHLQSQRSITFVQLPLMSRPYCLIRTALRQSPLEKLVCTVVWRQSLDLGQGTQMTWPTPLQ